MSEIDLDPDTMIRRMFQRCSTVSDLGALRFAIVNDHGWILTARCDHGSWEEASDSPVHLTKGIEKLYRVFMDDHPRPEWLG